MRQNPDLTSCEEDPPTNQDPRVPSLLEDVAWPVRTERLILRPATLHDTEATWQIRRLESVSRWLTRAPHTLDAYRADFADPASLEKSLVIELDTQVIGDLMVAVGDAWAQAEVADKAKRVQADLGWVIHPDFGGRGLATEAVRAVLRICFEQLGLRRVTAECFSAKRTLVVADGTTRHAAGDPHGQRIAAPLRYVARRVRIRASRRGMAASGAG